MEKCFGNYDAAMHYDCDECEVNCEFRKGFMSSSERIAIACNIALFTTLFFWAIYSVACWAGII